MAYHALYIGLFLLSSVALAAPASSKKPTPQEARELLSGVCGSGARTGSCTPCPAFSSGLDGPFTPTAVIYGKFTDPRRTDALLDMQGCEAHVTNFGGSLLLRWQGLTRWTQTRYLQSLRTGQCSKFPAQDGRDLLLCEGYYGGMGTRISSLSLLDLGRSDPGRQFLFSAYDSSEACLKDGSVQELLEWKPVTLNGDRFPDLRVRISSAALTHPGQDPRDPCGGVLRTAPRRTYTLEYTFDGSSFRPTAATRTALKALERDNPYFLGN